MKKTFSNRKVSNSIRNQIITVKNFCGWKKYYIDDKKNCGVDFFLKNPKPQKFLTVTYVKKVLTYTLCNLLNKLENCIELLIDRI